MRKMYRDLVDKNIITFTTDSNYLPFAKILINSILQNTPSVEILGRFVNCSDEQLDTVNGIHIYRDNKELSTKRNLLTKQHLYATDDFVYCNKTDVQPVRLYYSELISYCSNIKFDTINTLLGIGVKSVIYLDVDSIVRGDLNKLFLELTKNDFCFYKDIPYSEQFKGSKRLEYNNFLYHGGLIGVNNNKQTKKIIKNITNEVLEDIFDWDIDERILPTIIQNDFNIININKKYKDEDLDIKSIVWSGSGKTKFTNNLYINECKKYK